MQYKEIVSVTGLGGLFQLLATKSDGAIVRSLADNTTRFIPSRLHNVTPLESIEIYTTGNNVRLHEVLQKMNESDKTRPEAKANPSDIKSYFKEVYPDMDEDRVYASDMKKMLKWYEILNGAQLLDFSSMSAAEEAGSGDVNGSAAKTDSEEADSSDADAQALVSEHDKKEEAVALVEDGGEKPAKKARAKKAAAEPGEEKQAKKTAAKKTEASETTEASKKATKPKKKDTE